MTCHRSSHRSSVVAKIVIVSAVALTAVPAYVHGRYRNRWTEPVQMAALARKSREIPDHLGQWDLIGQGKPLPDAVREALELRGSVHKIYRHRQSGQTVALLVLVGPAGPLVRHPAEICYGARANQLLDSETIQIGTHTALHRLKQLHFQSRAGRRESFLVAYAFGCGGRWDVPASPRMAYSGQPALMKLQVVSDVDEDRIDQQRRELRAFLQAVLGNPPLGT